MYITEKCEYVFVQNQMKKVVLRVCGKKKKKKTQKKKKLLASVMFLFYVFDFLLFLFF